MIDISDPLNPRILASVALPGWVGAVALGGNYAYVLGVTGHYDGHLAVVDIADPEHPEAVGDLDLPDDSGDLAVSGTYVYIAQQFGLQVVDVRIPEVP